MLRKKIAVIAFAVWAPTAWSAKKPITIDAVLQSEAKQRDTYGTITWAPNGLQFIVNRSGTLFLYEVRSGQSHDVITLTKLENAAVKTNRSDAGYDWTNRRVEESKVQWFADNRRVLVSASGDLFVVDVAKGTFDQLTKTAEVEHDPKLSPDNKYVSFRRGANLYTLSIGSKSVNQLTKNGSDTLLNGELDWVYPEELEIGTAHWWSPDSRYIAYMQFDITHEPVFPQVSLLNHRAMLEPQRFPQPGDPNAEVRLGVVPATGGNTRWMNLGDPRGTLMARVAWSPSSREIAVEKLPRIQNKLDLLLANIETGAARVLLHEEDAQWINVNGEPQFLGDGNRFLWTSERSGFRHLYVYGIDGALQKQLTSGDWGVDEVAGLDQQHNRVFFTSTEDSPLERQLYVIGSDGNGQQRLTKGEGTHSISLSPDGAYYMDDYSALTAPPRQTLFKGDGSEVRVYRQPDLSEANEYEILRTEIVKVTASDGTLLYARLIKPAGFETGKRYPAVVMVYGGPHVQTVHNSWQGVSVDQVLAHKGFVIWQLDNRGSSDRGHKFESCIYRDLGSHELEDQKTGIQYLIGLGLVDPQRIGMFGWSYGGYMTLYTVTNAPGLIKAAIAGAPVTNWRNYDTIYTERYMGLPDENEHGYETSSPISKAANLQSKLLILHNIEDDNVHFQNSVQMAAALEKAGKQFFMVVYPQKSHGVSEPFRRQLLEQTAEFFEQNLK
jgi:dipeptidyl-peptidase 4